MDCYLVNIFDLPALLGVNPGIGFGLVATTHTTYNAAAQTGAQMLQRDTLQYWLKEALHDDAFSLRTWNTTYHQVEELVFIDLARGGTVAGTDLVGSDLSARDKFTACLLA